MDMVRKIDEAHTAWVKKASEALLQADAANKSIAAGNLTKSVSTDVQDEISQLLNDMDLMGAI